MRLEMINLVIAVAFLAMWLFAGRVLIRQHSGRV